MKRIIAGAWLIALLVSHLWATRNGVPPGWAHPATLQDVLLNPWFWLFGLPLMLAAALFGAFGLFGLYTAVRHPNTGNGDTRL
jgi:hypothetical protein